MTETSSTAASLSPSVVVLPLRLESSEDGRARDLQRHDMSLAASRGRDFRRASVSSAHAFPDARARCRSNDASRT